MAPTTPTHETTQEKEALKSVAKIRAIGETLDEIGDESIKDRIIVETNFYDDVNNKNNKNR
jgi:hypothetical protein